MKITVDLHEEAVKVLAGAIAEEMRDLLAPAASPVEYVSREDAGHLGVERKALLRAERAGELPAFRPGKTVLYRRQDVVALIERSRVAPTPANDAQALEGDPFERAIANAQRRRIR